MYGDTTAPPRMFHALYQWATSQRDVGNLDGAASAAESLVRESQTVEETRQACRLLADLHRMRGDLVAARQAAEYLVEVSRGAAERDPAVERQVDLLTALDELGEIARQAEDHWTVLECHGNHGRMGVLRTLVDGHGPQVALLTEQCYSLRRAGTAARAMGSYEEALSLFEERLTVARLTYAGSPSDRKLVALVAAALSDLGGTLAVLGERRAADLLREELALRTWLESTGSLDATGKMELAQCHLAMTRVGIDTGQHRRIAADLLTELERQGALDISGRILLTSLRTG